MLSVSDGRQGPTGGFSSDGGSGAGLLPDLAALLPAVFGLPAGGRAPRQEMETGAFSRQWLLPPGADPDTLHDGVLRLR